MCPHSHTLSLSINQPAVYCCNNYNASTIHLRQFCNHTSADDTTPTRRPIMQYLIDLYGEPSNSTSLASASFSKPSTPTSTASATATAPSSSDVSSTPTVSTSGGVAGLTVRSEDLWPRDAHSYRQRARINSFLSWAATRIRHPIDALLSQKVYCVIEPSINRSTVQATTASSASTLPTPRSTLAATTEPIVVCRLTDDHASCTRRSINPNVATAIVMSRLKMHRAWSSRHWRFSMQPWAKRHSLLATT
jgi:hypothetical protein